MPVLEAPTIQDVKKHAGEWVALSKGRILFGAKTAAEVSAWITEHNEKPDMVYRIPAPGEPTSYFF